MDAYGKNKNCIMICDDDVINREVLKNIFSAHYTFEEAETGVEGLKLIEKTQDKLCAIILDIQMPEMSGVELLDVLNKRGITDRIPTFLITAYGEESIVEEAYNKGVMDVVSKPVTPQIIQRRIETVVELFSARERLSAKIDSQDKKLSENAEVIDELHRGMIEALATAIEFRDVESGQHVNRIYSMTKHILTHTKFGFGLSDEEIENIARGSIMHDVGKIAISDIILNKPGKLTQEEFEIMKLHTVKGADLLMKILDMHKHESYKYAWDIARHHHERWDGRGYPDKLKGDEISIAAQVVSIVDVYDALVSERVYKKSFEHSVAVEMIKNGECGMFNPMLVDCFLSVADEFKLWYETNEIIVSNDEERKPEVKNEAFVSGEHSNVVLLMAAVQSAYDLIMFANVTKNSYHVMDYEKFLNHKASSDGVFDDLINDGASTVPEEYREAFIDSFSREKLLEAFKAGKRNISLEHEQFDDEGKIHRMRTDVLLMTDGRSGDILNVTLSRCIDEEWAEKEKTRNLLKDALELAEQGNKAKTTFLSRVSHDMRTPLNIIMGLTKIMQSTLDDGEKLSDYIEKIDLTSKNLLGYITDILEYTKIDGESLLLNSQKFNLVKMLEEIELATSYHAREKLQTATVKICDDVKIWYIGDEFRIRQILMNLLENANQYTPEGGKYSLTVDTVKNGEECEVVRFVVEDNGIGIKEEFIEKLFEPFWQNTSNLNSRGPGFGLTTARNLVHLMNGEMKVSGRWGEGAVFTVELPLGKAEEADDKNNIRGEEEIFSFDGVKVLLAEDNDLNCEVAKTTMELNGIEVDVAHDGKRAVELFENSKIGEYTAIFMDIQMPVMNGHEATAKIRGMERSDAGNIPIYAVTANAYYVDEVEAKAHGMTGHLAKPVDFVRILGILKEIVKNG